MSKEWRLGCEHCERYKARAESAEAERDKLAEENKRLREALRPFKEVADHPDFPQNGIGYEDDFDYEDSDLYRTGESLTYGAFRRARAAMGE